MSSQEALSGSRCSSLSSSHGSRLASSTDLSRVDAPDLIADKQLPLDQHHCKNLIITNDANDAKTKIKQNMIDLLWAENSALKTELDIYHKKISRMKQLELEIQNVQQAYDDLIHSSEKKEQLERAIRFRLEFELGIVKERNKELKGEKERQEIELQAQRLTLEEQRNHIDILDNALICAQTNIQKLEAEVRKKQAYEERCNHMQKALSNLQLSSDRRIQMEKRVRTHLEKQLESLKKQQDTPQQPPIHHQQSLSGPATDKPSL